MALFWEGMSIAEERDPTGATTQKRYLGQGMEIASGPAAGEYLYNRDHLGSIRELIDNDSSAAVRARYDFDLWGKRSANLVTTGAVEADFAFTGHFFHAQSGLNLAPYRAYDPETGRWISRDWIGERDGVNVYTYVRNIPVKMVDPSGMAATVAGGAAIGGIAGGLIGGFWGAATATGKGGAPATFKDRLVGAAKGAFSGAVGGAIAGGMIGAGAPAWAAMAVGGAVTSATGQLLNGQNPFVGAGAAMTVGAAGVGALASIVLAPLPPGLATELAAGAATGTVTTAIDLFIDTAKGLHDLIENLLDPSKRLEPMKMNLKAVLHQIRFLVLHHRRRSKKG